MKKLNQFLISSFIFFVLLVSISFSQSLTFEGPVPLADTPVQVQDSTCGNLEITQSATQSLAGAGLACNAGNIVRQNSFYRAFDLSSFNINFDFEVCAVEIGIFQAIAASGSQPLTVNLYTSDPAFPNGVLTQIGTTDIQLTDQNLTIVSIPVSGLAPVDTELVVEIFVPDGQADSNTFFMGSNSDGQTGPSYIEAAACSVPTPTPFSDLGFQDGYVMNVIGNEIIPERDVPTLSEWGLISMAGILGIVGFMVMRRRKATA